MRACTRVLLACLLTASAACAPPVDLKRGIEVLDVSTGWFDAGIVNGQNKLVPTVSFKLKNISSQSLPMLQVNASFRRVSENEEWFASLVTAAGSGGLAPGASTATLTVKSQLGYTGSDQTRQDMLRNSQFVDAKVKLLAKYGSAQWTPIAEFPIARQLITN
jgi:hypothetical protein